MLIVGCDDCVLLGSWLLCVVVVFLFWFGVVSVV